MDKIGDRIRVIMESNGMNYRLLARATSMTDAQVGNIVKNKSIPKVDFILKLYNNVPNVDLHWLITGELSDAKNHGSDAIAEYAFYNWDKMMEHKPFESRFNEKAARYAVKILQEEKEKRENKK